jgi:hypothetical protein
MKKFKFKKKKSYPINFWQKNMKKIKNNFVIKKTILLIF